VDFKEILSEGVDRIDVVKDKDTRRAVMNMVMNIWVP
jgi:hypothetical protein